MSVHTPHTDADLIILGGGCAGLSLAARLAISTSALRVIVLESRTQYEEDRTWCGWRTKPHPYNDCVAATWHQWRIADAEIEFARGSTLYPYEMIPADRFYERSREWIESSDNVCLQMEAQVVDLAAETEFVQVELANGKKLTGRWVVDTRPQFRKLQAPWLWQNFVGYEVHGDTALSEKFGTTPILMDFQPPGTSAVQFMYILPLAQHSYLFEWTRFSREPGEHEEITAQLMQWLATNTGTGNSLGRRECGSLPMAPCMVKADPGRIITAGTAGGSMRAATGYAFHAIQRWADQCQASLVAGGPPVAPKQNQLLNFMDEVFLRALQQNSASSESILCALFSRTEPDALIRFLTGLPRSSDLWSVIQSLPWLPFIKATFACIAGGRES